MNTHNPASINDAHLDTARTAPMASAAAAPTGTYTRLERLSDLDDFEVADGQPDIRGWDVCTMDGAEIGEVDDLIAEPDALTIRYLNVKVKHELLGTDDDQHVLVPINLAHLNDDDDVVMLGQLPSGGLRSAPRCRDGEITAEDARLLAAYYGTGSAGVAGAAGYRALDDAPRTTTDKQSLTLSEEQLAVGKQKVQQGEVTLNKRVETRHVEQEVPLVREEIVVERRAATGTAAGTTRGSDAKIGEGEVRIPLMGEQVVTQKRVVPLEEIVISKRLVTDTGSVEADLRRERLDVDRKKT